MAFDPSIVPNNKKLKLTLDSSQISTDQTDYPVTIPLGTSVGKNSFDASAVFDELGVNNKRLSIDVGGTQCPVEIENWDSTNEKATLHTKIPTYTGSVDPELILSFDNSQPDNDAYVGDTGDTPAQSVWDSDFVAVYHMAQDPSIGGACILDSTSNVYHGTPYGSMTSDDLVDGLIGKAIDFDKADDYIDCGNIGGGTGYLTFTAEVMFYTDSTDGISNYILSKDGSGNNNGDGSLYFDGSRDLLWHNENSYGDVTGDNFSVIGNSWVLCTYAVDNGDHELFQNGVSKDTATQAHIVWDNSFNVQIGGVLSGSYLFDGKVAEVRISSITRSDAWIKLTNLSLTDQIITWSIISDGVILTSLMTESYYLESGAMISMMVEPYYLSDEIFKSMNQLYSLLMSVTLNESYQDNFIITKIINEFYGDRPTLVKFLNMLYGDSRGLLKITDLPYNLQAGLQKLLEESYYITEQPISATFNEMYDLWLYNPIKKRLDEMYAIAADSVIEIQDLVVEIDGVRVYPTLVNYEFNIDEYGATVEIHLARLEDYQLVKEYQSIIRVVDSDGEFFFLAEIPRINETLAQTMYVVTGYSRSVNLERAASLTQEFPGGLASDAANALSSIYGITVTWEAYNYYIPPNVFYVNDETPIEAIKRLSGAINARLQPTFSGDLRVIKEYEFDTPKWETSPATYLLTDQRDFFSTGETIELRDNFNVYRITDQDIAEDDLFLEEEIIDSQNKFIKGFQIPFSDIEVELKTSGGSGVQIEPLGVVIEQLEPEVIEIIKGEGKTSHPIFQVVSTRYIHDSLGSITTSEDGAVKTTNPGQSLIEIIYETRYRLWKATDRRIGQIQFWLKGEGE